MNDKELLEELVGQLGEYILLCEQFDDYAGRNIDYLNELNDRLNQQLKDW